MRKICRRKGRGWCWICPSKLPCTPAYSFSAAPKTLISVQAPHSPSHTLVNTSAKYQNTFRSQAVISVRGRHNGGAGSVRREGVETDYGHGSRSAYSGNPGGQP